MAALRAFVLTPSRSATISNPKRFQGSKINVPVSAKNALGSNSENSNSSPSEEKRVDKSFKKSSQSSWDAKNSEGKDYLYRLGQEADNVNVTVGARKGLVDDLFVGKFLGKDADIVFDYRQKVTRSFEHLQGDYYIAPAFMEKIVLHIVKNYMAHLMDISIPLILGVWGGKGQGKSFQTELIFRAMGIEPVIMSAGELESERAGEPGKLIRERYRTASQVIKNQGKMSCLMINDLDAGVGRFANTQVTVNNQIVMGTLMNLADNPTRVSIGQDWRESDITNRVPIIVTGNDFSTLYAPLIRDGRMEKFYWQPTREDLINIVHRMYQNDGILKDEVARIVDSFPNQALDFYGALRSRTYDRIVLKWVEDIGGAEKLGEKLLRRHKDDDLPPFIPPKGKMSCLMINDLDAGVGRFANTQVTVNNQIVMGTLMNLADNPTRVSIGQDWRESDITNRVPIIVTGNDFSTLYAPLIRDGRMEKFYWQPTREDLINIVHRMYQNDGILKDEVARIVDSFPNQALDFYGALRSRTYDRIVLKWVEDIGGAEKLGEKLLRRHKDDDLPPFIPPKQTIENLMEAGQSLIEEQQMVMKMRLSEDYMKNSKT